MQAEFKYKGHIFLGYFKYGFKLLKPTYKLWYWNIFMTQNFSHLWAIMDHDHGDNLSLGAQSLPFNITEIKITPFIQWRQSLKSLRHMFPVTLYWRVTSTFPLYFCPTIDDRGIFISDAMSRIQSGPSIYVKEGSVLNLTYVFSGHVTSAKHIHWWDRTQSFRQSFYDLRFRWRGSELLNTADRGGISIVSNKVQ